LNVETQKQIRKEGFSRFLGASYFKLRQEGVSDNMVEQIRKCIVIPNFVENVEAMKRQILWNKEGLGKAVV
jgi:hypothetical protein